MRKRNTSFSFHSNSEIPKLSIDCEDDDTICFSSQEFIGDQNPSTSNPPGGINLNTSPYNSYTSFAFNSCLFRDCKASSGGGIYLAVSSSSVTLCVTSGKFYECKATDALGGGIYCSGIGDLTVEHSFFSWCTCRVSGDSGGGGIGMDNIKTQMCVQNCDFDHCSSGNDGGGISIWYSNSLLNTLPITDCRFLYGYSNHSGNGDGGGIHMHYNNHIFGLSDCLFSLCHSDYRGGGSAIASNAYRESLYPVVCFSFFHGNSANTNNGKDAYFEGRLASDSDLILHSFTTSSGHYRVTPEHWDITNHQDEWLPLALPMYVKCNGVATFEQS